MPMFLFVYEVVFLTPLVRATLTGAPQGLLVPYWLFYCHLLNGFFPKSKDNSFAFYNDNAGSLIAGDSYSYLQQWVLDFRAAHSNS